MRKILPIGLAAAAAAVLFAGCGKEENLKRHIVLFPNSKNFKEEWFIKVLPNGDTLMHGVNKEFFWGGTVKKSIIWKEGKRDGSAQAWYDNGQAQYQKTYDNGKKVGLWRLFFPNGQPWMVVNYVDDALEGKAQVWDKDDASAPKEATFSKGSCVSGECGILDPRLIPEDVLPADKTVLERDNLAVAEFLN